MYFSLVPDINYDKKPISYPFSESDFIIAKNFFRRYQINPDIFDVAVYYNKYTIENGKRLDQIAYDAYGNSQYDWIIILTNNMVDPLFSLPVDDYTVGVMAEEKYGSETYSGIHHYETLEVKTGQKLNGIDIIALESGLVVDETFYNSNFEYWNGTSTISIPGTSAAKPVYNYDYEVQQNEKKREIFVLKSGLINRFVNEFKTRVLYGECSEFITKKLKKVAV